MSMEVTVHREGAGKLAGYSLIVQARLRRAIGNGAVAIQENAVKSIVRKHAEGIVYTRKGIEHQASAPGQAPASDTGELAKSILVRNADDGLSAVVVCTDPKGMWLEFGTEHMEPRPFMEPAFRKAEPKIRRDVERALAIEGGE